MLSMIFLLLILYQMKHFLADYPLQGKYCLGKFKPGWDFLGPLAVHCSVHSGMTLGIVMYMNRSELWWLAIFDFVVHFTMDRIKAGPKYLGRFKALSGSEMMRLISMGSVSTETDPDKIPYPSVTPEFDRDRQRQFKNNTFFWWSLGLDQMVHHLTHYYIIYKLVT